MAMISDGSTGLALESASIEVFAPRDLRLDFFRGMALYMIFIDHVVGDPLSHFTYQAIGFSDAAEIFVYLSGLGCGIAYSRTLARKGWPAVIWAAIRRAIRIYVFYLASGAAVIVLAAMTADIWAFPEFTHTLGFAANHPFSSFRLLAVMQSSPADSGILVLYIAFTLIAVPLFLAGSSRYPLGALVASGCIWLMSRQLHDTFSFLIGGWYLNPFAWQFLFSVGMYFGIAWDRPESVCVSRLWPRWLLPLALAVIAGAFFYKLALFLLPHMGFDSSWLRIPRPMLADMKKHLSSWRLAHFLGVLYVVAAYVRPANPVIRWPVAKPLILSGQHSLEIFSMTIILGMLDNIAVMTLRPSLMERLFFDFLAFLVIAITAFILARSRNAAPARLA